MEWTKQFFINVKNSVPGAIDYTPTVIVTNTGTVEYTVGHPAGKLEATVVRDANTPGGSLLRYQWYSKAEGATKYPFIKYIPIGDAMSKSYLSGCAMTCRMKQPDCT